MQRFDYTDFIGGMLLAAIGVAITAIAYTSYQMGTISRMGPGMFPAILGVVLALIGVLLAVQALRREGHPVSIRVFSPLFVLGGVMAFALTIRSFGLVPAVLSCILISSLAELRLRPVSLGLLCLALCTGVPVIFVGLLGLQIPLFAWPL